MGGSHESPFKMKGSPYKKVLPTVTVSAKKNTVKTVMNKDGSITKSKGKKSATYNPDPKKKGRYVNPKTGGDFFIS